MALITGIVNNGVILTGPAADGASGQVLTTDGDGNLVFEDASGGITDHGALTGLGDDDHTQYHNNARGDARYSQLGHAHAFSELTGSIDDSQIPSGITRDSELTAGLATKQDTGAAAGGDLSGTYPNPQIATGVIVNADINASAAIALSKLATDPLARANHTGTQSADTLTDGTTNKAFLATERTKLAGIATGATANDTDANLRARSSHTGTQLASTISDFNTAALTAAPAETTTTIGALTTGATAKTTPVDADQFGIVDSAASNIWKKITWANIKAALKSYIEGVTFTSLSSLSYKVGSNEILNATGQIKYITGPYSLTANQNDLGIGIVSTAGITASSGPFSITGITAPADGIAGWQTEIRNVGSNAFNLTHQDTNSAAANRIICPGNATLTINAGERYVIEYTSAPTSRWTVLKVEENPTTVGAIISNATDKTTPVDADYVGLMDSASSNILKKLSWANLKATAKTYFDTLYQPVNASAGGDLTGTYPNPTIAAGVIVDADINASAAINVDKTADGTTNKVFTATDKTKLAGIATGATANSSDATLLARANHTGTQTASTVSDFNTAALAAAPAETTTTIGALTTGATAKTTPVDADQIGLVDSAASNVWKKVTWANVKATLKTYTDTLYQAVHQNLTDISGITRTKGDLIVASSSAWGDLAVGTDGHVLTADSAQTLGVKWAAAAGGGAPSPDVQTFSASGTWTKPGGSHSWARIRGIGGGGGGGSGRKGALSSVRGGGSGGGGAGAFDMIVPFSSLASSETVTIGAGGGGGAAQSTNDTNGSNGTAGGDTTFGSHFLGPGGGAGGAGTTSTFLAGGTPGNNSTAAVGTLSTLTGTAGGNGGTGSAAGGRAYFGGGGGGGGGYFPNAVNTAQVGFAGGSSANFTLNTVLNGVGGGGTAGSSAGGAGGAGGNPTALAFLGGHGGGGGGAAANGATAGNGGAGGRGAGGGGGAASTNGTNSGAGGAGGDGYVEVICY